MNKNKLKRVFSKPKNEYKEYATQINNNNDFFFHSFITILGFSIHYILKIIWPFVSEFVSVDCSLQNLIVLISKV